MADNKVKLTILVDDNFDDNHEKGNNNNPDKNLGPFCSNCGVGPLAPNVLGNCNFCCLCREMCK